MPIVAEGHEFAVRPILDAIDVRQPERKFPRRKSRHEHLYRRRLRDRYKWVESTRHLGATGLQRGVFLIQILSHPLSFLNGQRTIISEDFSNVAVEEALGKWQIRGVRVEAGAHCDFVGVDNRS